MGAVQVAAVGHSAGAHMWAMVLLERARAAKKKGSQRSSAVAGHAGHDSSNGGLESADGGPQSDRWPDHRMPARFIGGVPPSYKTQERSGVLSLLCWICSGRLAGAACTLSLCRLIGILP